MSITERFMGFFKSYPSTRHFLGGVIKDFKALQDLTERVGEQWDTFLLLDRDLRTLETGLLFVDPSILWMCGHGKLVDNENVFLIEPPRTNVSDATVLSGTRLTDFLKRTARRTVLYVFDFCHSCTMINLKYYYEDDVYLEKVLSAEPTIWDDSPTKRIVAIAGATDFDVANEDASGGRLTQFLVGLLNRHGHLTLRMIDSQRPPFLRGAVISCNRRIDPDESLLDISSVLLNERLCISTDPED